MSLPGAVAGYKGSVAQNSMMSKYSKVLVSAAVFIYIGSLLALLKMMRIIDNHQVGDIMSPEKIKTEINYAKSPRDLTEPSTTKRDQRNQYNEMAMEIAAKWNLTTPNAASLLVQQFEKVIGHQSKLKSASITAHTRGKSGSRKLQLSDLSPKLQPKGQ